LPGFAVPSAAGGAATVRVPAAGLPFPLFSLSVIALSSASRRPPSPRQSRRARGHRRYRRRRIIAIRRRRWDDLGFDGEYYTVLFADDNQPRAEAYGRSVA
jgi:hypothetical protein